MNKKLLLATMSLAALAACTNYDEFGSKTIAEETSPVQFEVLNNNQAMTRASMNGNTISWSAADGDLFTLYHGAAVGNVNGFENATYKASTGEGAATLTTPSMIKAGGAVMVWPVDSTFRITPANDLTIKIPAEQTADIENNIPYVSDLIEIEPYAAYSETPAAPGEIPTANKTAGYNRTYKVYMRPMASQLTIKADYAGTEETIATLYEGENAIDPIKVTSVELSSPAAANYFTTEIPVEFTAENAAWAEVEGHKWVKVTNVNKAGIAEKSATLSTECLTGNESCKFLILPQTDIADADPNASITVNTIYGKVIIADKASSATTKTKYTVDEAKDAWARYIKATTAAVAGEEKATTPESAGENAGKYKATTTIKEGLMNTINTFSTYTTQSATSPVKGEPTGTAATRYVKVLLTHLDMDGLHVKSDKQLRDAARVWKLIGDKSVKVLLDGDRKTKEFEISQKTIQVINEINAELAEGDAPRSFTVAPCVEHLCETIVITGGGDINKDLTFIEDNATTKAAVALNAGETWKWNGTDPAADGVKQIVVGTGVSKIINRGTLVNAATATLAVYNVVADVITPTDAVPFENAETGIWNITGGTLNVQFNVTNYGTVNIAKGAQYRQAGNFVFTNDAATLPERFYLNDPSKTPAEKAAFVEKIGVVNNKGVFATVDAAQINNYGVIEHADKDAKTYITNNQINGNFADAFAEINKMGRINLPFSNKDEDNISISAAANQGFVSVTVTTADAPSTKKLDASELGEFVNYVIVKSGIESITSIANEVEYVEIDATNEIVWEPRYKIVAGVKTVDPYVYTGLMVFSDVNIKLNTVVGVTGSTFLAADMYVGGKFNNDGTVGGTTLPSFTGYFGNTDSNKASKIITY